jgi:hypothetical protein
MKTLEVFKQFYTDSLVEPLKPIEALRKKTMFLLIGIILTLFAAMVAVFYLSPRFGWDYPILIGAVVVFSFLAGLTIYFLPRKYVHSFKSIVIPLIIEFVNKDLTYSRNRHIPRSAFMKSQIFKKQPDEYTGDDLVSGKVGATFIRFSEIDASYTSILTNQELDATDQKRLFKGLFIIADFNKKFTGKTIVLPDTLEKFFGRLGKKMQSWDKRWGRQINLENPEFEKYFEVYGDDQVTSRYILSTSLMERITRFRKETKKSIALSFVDSLMYIAIPYNRNLFEPRLFRSILSFKPMGEYFHDLNLALGVIEDMNLNRRIWGKEKTAAITPGNRDEIGPLVKKGSQLFKAGSYKEANTVYSDIIARNPEHTTACFNRGVTRKKMGNAREAYEDFKRAATLGHPKAKSILKSSAFDEFKKEDTARIKNRARQIKEVMKNGDIIAMCMDGSDGSYWKYKNDAWLVDASTETLEKICSVDDFMNKIASGEIDAESMDDFITG